MRLALSALECWLAGGLLITDGAWGTELHARGLPSGTTPDTWNLAHPERVEEVARAYAEAVPQGLKPTLILRHLRHD